MQFSALRVQNLPAGLSAQSARQVFRVEFNRRRLPWFDLEYFLLTRLCRQRSDIISLEPGY